MQGLMRDWLRNAREWFAYVTAAAVVVAMIVTVSHALAWVGRSYGGATLLVVVVALCVFLIAGGSAVQTYAARRRLPDVASKKTTTS